jgi:hypothetical protein
MAAAMHCQWWQYLVGLKRSPQRLLKQKFGFSQLADGLNSAGGVLVAFENNSLLRIIGNHEGSISQGKR